MAGPKFEKRALKARIRTMFHFSGSMVGREGRFSRSRRDPADLLGTSGSRRSRKNRASSKSRPPLSGQKSDWPNFGPAMGGHAYDRLFGLGRNCLTIAQFDVGEIEVLAASRSPPGLEIENRGPGGPRSPAEVGLLLLRVVKRASKGGVVKEGSPCRSRFRQRELGHPKVAGCVPKSCLDPGNSEVAEKLSKSCLGNPAQIRSTWADVGQQLAAKLATKPKLAKSTQQLANIGPSCPVGPILTQIGRF